MKITFEIGDRVVERSTGRVGTVDTYNLLRGASARITKSRKYVVRMDDTGKNEYFNVTGLRPHKTVLAGDVEGVMIGENK